MTTWSLPQRATCRCERTELRISAPPLITMACHCTGCQRMSASAFSLSVGGPAQGFDVVKGAPEIGGIHGEDRHYHCPHCKSWMFTRPHGMDDFVNVRATMLDDRRWYAPFVEVWTDEGYAWAKTGAPYSFGALPPMEAWSEMMAAFAQRGPHPL